MIDVNKLKRDQTEALAEMRALATAVEKRDEDKRSLTPEELTRSTELQARVAALTTEIAQAEMLNADETRELAAKNGEKRGGGDRGNGDGDGDEFRSFGEFMGAISRGDTQNMQKREQSMGTGKKGGFLVPREFDKEIRAMRPEDGIVRPNAMVISAGSSTPDAPIDLPALDQTGDKGVHGGMVMNWTGETGQKKNAGDIEFIMVSLEPNNITGYVEVTNKLLNNTEAFASYLMQIMAGAIAATEEYAFYLGDGAGKPLGILNSKAVIKIERETAGKITYNDLVDMNALIKGTDLKWVINRTVLPALQKMVPEDTTTLAWQASAVVGEPDTVLGLPVLYNENSPVLGEFGDIALLDMKQYAIKDGTGLSVRLDDITQAEYDKTRIYISWNVDGQSLLTDSILMADKKTRRSPFIVLDAK